MTHRCRATTVDIGGRLVGADHPPFLIAEAGINHNGDVALALRMVAAAKAAGVDAVKFQTFKASEFVADASTTFTYRSQGIEVTESMLGMFERYELPKASWLAIKAECDRLGIRFLSTPQNPSDLELLLEIGIDAIKVGSDDFTNIPLLKRYVAAGLPLLLSCGMADFAEVYRSLECVGALDCYPVVLLLCTSEYPTPAADVNLKKLATLGAAFPTVVLGFSDHTRDTVAASVATAFGAALFEKHFTLDRELPGPDHWFSETPETLANWASSIRTAHMSLGDAMVRPTPAEIDMRKIARRSVVAIAHILPGAVFTHDNIALRRPGTGLPPDMLDMVLGGTATKALAPGDPLAFGDVAS